MTNTYEQVYKQNDHGDIFRGRMQVDKNATNKQPLLVYYLVNPLKIYGNDALH